MKALRERMKKMNLTIATKTEDVTGAGPEPLSPTSSMRSGAVSPKEAKKKSSRKGIQRVSDTELASMYAIKGTVMESTHQGMHVLFGKRLSDGQEVVVKTRDKATSFKGNWEEREWRDTTAVQLNMPKIDSMCEYIAVYETWEKYYVIMERAMGMDLFEQLQKETMKQEQTRQIMFQMLQALDSMHQCGRIHKDLKLENVVVDMVSPKTRKCRSNGAFTSIEAKLIDFDTVQDWEPTSPKAKDVLGTDGYIAPEAYAGEYSPASDIYCTGVIMYKLLTRRFPSRADIFDDLPGENWVGSPAMKRIQERLKKEKIDFKRPPLDKSPHAQDLLKKMLAFDPNERPSAGEALEHKWFMLQGDSQQLPNPASPSVQSTAAGDSVKGSPGTSSCSSRKDNSNDTSTQSGSLSPKAASELPKLGSASPKAGSGSPKAGSASPKAGLGSPKAASPKAGSPAAKEEAQTPVSLPGATE